MNNKLSGYLVIVAFVFFLSALFYFIDEIYIKRITIQRIEFRIEKGENLNFVIARLKDSGLVRNKFLVRLYTFLSGSESVKPGSYSIGPEYSVRDIFVNFIEGSDMEMKIFEGWTSKDIALALEEQKMIKSGSEFLKLAKNFDNSLAGYNFLPSKKEIDLEGYLFPDTYRFQRGSEISVIETMLDNFNKKVYFRYPKSQEELRNILIMASMLEREVQTEEDMRFVSGILWKRFESEIGLQVDATLVYVKCVLMTDPDKIDPTCRQITNGDKNLDSLYNTYLYKGLPPGAISNPSLKAIKAAMSPVESGYWYYLSARDDGRTIFSSTLDEHNMNRVIYR
ncbi:MAG: hypothetical protein A2913_01400 [Parcubacteria group bacterium RIFCSPLOWO2_01_FULL_40_65]|nr:MAG: hypothetical protein A2734_00375 [Parcubacteria group bacterium RIFCSPHIGHO2_01_FULL_40_30]OHB18774.1 MAG: hypothetical protein A3D40_00145 [Parcubacteria group bacterium RIFCSPHIGHO2_02_FULL_40_12]OHB20990.1 MAG: hypothetical protein A2913_01400 [Parcubacteria group bacterium RIFCSPLOWO2_01_FULL_40_65]OHB22652.1 MAG: hypothetical protein A3I22_02365 [Parcubacteria group bacterium RIFCSPLOWO2_02_FULL_40_12]OHB23979.1 MAG: hypothetical protein A3F96_00345 [Parcubacteria group bacterium R